MPQHLDLDEALQRIAGELSQLAGRIKHEGEVIEGAGEDAERAGMKDTAEAAKKASKAQDKAAEAIEEAAEEMRDASDDQREAADEAKREASESVTTEDVADAVSEGNPIEGPEYRVDTIVEGAWEEGRRFSTLDAADDYAQKQVRELKQKIPDKDWKIDIWEESGGGQSSLVTDPIVNRVSEGNPMDEGEAAGSVTEAVAEGVEKGNPIDSGDIEDLRNDIVELIDFVDDLIADAEHSSDKTDLQKIKSQLRNAEDTIDDPAKWPIAKNVSKGNPFPKAEQEFVLYSSSGSEIGTFSSLSEAEDNAPDNDRWVIITRSHNVEAAGNSDLHDRIEQRLSKGNPVEGADVAATEAALDVDTQDAVAASAAADTKPKASHPYYRPLFKIGG